MSNPTCRSGVSITHDSELLTCEGSALQPVMWLSLMISYLFLSSCFQFIYFVTTQRRKTLSGYFCIFLTPYDATQEHRTFIYSQQKDGIFFFFFLWTALIKEKGFFSCILAFCNVNSWMSGCLDVSELNKQPHVGCRARKASEFVFCRTLSVW